MFGGAVARVVEHRRRRCGAPERAIVTHINPTSPRGSLALGQDRHGGVVAVQPFSREDMGFHTLQQRLEHGAAGSHMVGQGRQTERHAFPGIALGLAIERLMLAKLLEQDHRQQAGPHQAAGDHMERCWRLADLLAIPARELLADILDHLLLPRDRFQRLGDRLPKIAQPAATAANTNGRSRHDHSFTRQMFGEWLARRTPAGERRHRRGLRHRLLGGDLVLGG